MSINNFYASQSNISNPLFYRKILQTLPDNIITLRNMVSELFLHYADFSSKDFYPNKSRYTEMDSRYLSLLLKLLIQKDNRSFTMNRRLSNRLLGICRDSALLLCGILRSKGVPSRLRFGYVNYTLPGIYLDGCCCEVYNAKDKVWRKVDTRTLANSGVDDSVDITDLKSHEFISAAHAWQLCRRNISKAACFGSRSHRGLVIIRNRLIQDFLSLLKVEMLLWDCWGLMFDSISKSYAICDQLSDLLLHDENNLPQLFKYYYQHPVLQIKNFVLVDSPFLQPYYSKVSI